MAVQQAQLQLDSSRSNPAFQSWRLSRGGEDESCASSRLRDHVYVAREGSYDYLHTRMSLLENHLKADGSALYIFLEGAGGVSVAKMDTSNTKCSMVTGEQSSEP